MSAQQATARGSADTDDLTCSAPSCWASGSVVTIAGTDIENPPVLCETHRRAYLGVST